MEQFYLITGRQGAQADRQQIGGGLIRRGALRGSSVRPALLSSGWREESDVGRTLFSEPKLIQAIPRLGYGAVIHREKPAVVKLLTHQAFANLLIDGRGLGAFLRGHGADSIFRFVSKALRP